MAQSLRFFYSINSYKSRGNSFDSLTTYNKTGSMDSQNSSPLMAARSSSKDGTAQTSEGLFGVRNGRLHTYCSPRSSNGLSNGSVKDYTPSSANSNATKILTLMQTSSSPVVSHSTPRSSLFSSIFRNGDKTDSSLERFV